MITFTLRVNGAAISVAGLRDMSVLTAIVTAVGKLGPDSAGTKHDPVHAAIDLRVGGMNAPLDGSPADHIEWVSRGLKIGDEVVIQIGDSKTADPPTERRVGDSSLEEERKIYDYARRMYFQLREKFEGSGEATEG